MELNQLLQTLVKNAGNPAGSGENITRSIPARVLTDLTRLVDADSAKTMLQLLQRAAGNSPAAPYTPAPARLPVIAVQISLQPATAATQKPAQLTLQLVLPAANGMTTAAGKDSSITIPLTRGQQQQIQQLQQQAANQPLVVVAKSVTPAIRGDTNATAQLNLQLVNPQQPKQTVNLQTPVAQLPKPIAQALVSNLTTAGAAMATVASNIPKPTSLIPADTTTPGVMLKQANQLTPQQFQQQLQQLITTAANSDSPQRPDQALTRLLHAVLQQLPATESMQQPLQLKQWVNDWFAAKPVATTSQQQLGALSKMLMLLLGTALQKPASANTSAAPLTGTQMQSAGRITQALLDQIMRPAPRLPGEASFTGEVRERINQLLQQLPQTQLQRLMQLFTSAVNSAQTSQARLAETAGATPEYFVLLPATGQQDERQHELLIRRERERNSDDESGRTVWLFTLRFELKQYGPLLVKGRYHDAGTRVDFYTESDKAQLAMEKEIKQLSERFQQLDVTGLNLRVQKGQVPDTLATQQSCIIRVTV